MAWLLAYHRHQGYELSRRELQDGVCGPVTVSIKSLIAA